MNKLAIARRQREDRDAPRRHETIRAALVLAFFCAAMIGAALIGDDRQQAALAEQYEELAAEERRSQHEAREQRHASNVWRRICIDGENWSSMRQQCE